MKNNHVTFLQSISIYYILKTFDPNFGIRNSFPPPIDVTLPPAFFNLLTVAGFLHLVVSIVADAPRFCGICWGVWRGSRFVGAETQPTLFEEISLGWGCGGGCLCWILFGKNKGQFEMEMMISNNLKEIASADTGGALWGLVEAELYGRTFILV